MDQYCEQCLRKDNKFITFCEIKICSVCAKEVGIELKDDYIIYKGKIAKIDYQTTGI